MKISRKFKSSIDNLSKYCSACGKDREFTDFEGLLKDEKEVLLRWFPGSETHWCQDCIEKVLILIDLWYKPEDGKFKDNEILEKIYNIGIHKYCVMCAGSLSQGRRYYCKKCKEHSQHEPNYLDIDEGTREQWLSEAEERIMNYRQKATERRSHEQPGRKEE